MRWQLVILASCLIISRTVPSAAECDASREPFVDKEFLILKSTPSFKEATQSATRAATTLGVGLDLRGLSPDLRTGLTFSKEACTRSEFPYPCYVPRGRRDGTYVSVEWSSKYEQFAKGMYVVMIASYAPGSSKTRHLLEATRRTYPDAYAKRVKLYVGCTY